MLEKKTNLLSNLKDFLSYDSVSGLFIWKTARGGKAIKDSLAGTLDQDGYIRIRFNGESWAAHHLAWWFVYGELPSFQIDHIDENKTHNAIHNLRDGTGSVQNLNKSKPRVDNKSTGFKGVTVHKRTPNRFMASLTYQGKRKYLGSFSTPEEAHQVYIREKNKLLLELK